MEYQFSKELPKEENSECPTNTILANIDQAYWLRTMEHYPETIEEFKLMISIFDKIGMFKKFDLDKIVQMEGDRLNIIYAILRIMNKMVNKYLDYVVKKIFKNRLEEIFVCTNLTYYDLFFDQLVQDIDGFVCSQICFINDISNNEIILKKVVDYLENIFQKDFYQGICKKLEYSITGDFFNNNMEILSTIVEEFVVYTKETLVETYLIMIGFLERIFSNTCNDNTVQETIKAFDKHFNLVELFNEDCMELQIYFENSFVY